MTRRVVTVVVLCGSLVLAVLGCSGAPPATQAPAKAPVARSATATPTRWTFTVDGVRPVTANGSQDTQAQAAGVVCASDQLAALCGVPIICHEKGFRRVGPVERIMSRWVDRAICMTDDIAAHYRARGVRAHQFLTIPDGIDPTRFTTGGGERVRDELGIAHDAPVVGIVGHIQEWKGQAIVVEAVARARRRIPDIRCLVVGGVHRAGADYAARLRELIAHEGLEQNVLLIGARRDVAACMSAMDVVLHASVTPEPFGRVLIEAMATGRPLIAPSEGGPRQIVVDGETGLLVPPRDPTALADAIVALLSAPARRIAMGAAARARVETIFDIRHQVRAVETVITDVLDGRRTMVEAA